MTNVVLYGSGEIEVRLRLDGADLFLEVSDHSLDASLVQPRLETLDIADGWRLRVVDLLVDRWGTSHSSQGRTTWVQRAVARRGLDDSDR